MRFSSFAPLALAALVFAFAASSPAADAASPAQPVVVELFTAEGCPACPAADALLERLAQEQPVRGAEVVALELHVDYFDRPGKVDPYAQPAFAARQAEYIRAFGKRGAYTPQLVVDGQREIVGAQERQTQEAIGDAARAPKAKVQVARDGDKLSVSVDGLPAGGERLDLWLALTEDGLSAREGPAAAAGHGPVVRELRKISSIASGARGPMRFDEVPVALDSAWRRERVRAVVFLQRDKTLEILGAGVVAMR
jgi:hypothetical protein